ncbi:MAG: 2,3-bisphosphoglycerate-independent phosphoglycerate mutase [Verrucomicrobia bacterium]|nr:2,3-bisphosphoglycerate-independent phosphoglycerate mutase [Verrucomicrobiota bacterium]
MMLTLQKSKSFSGPRGPVVLAIMDGTGIGKFKEGDFVASAYKPNWDWLKQHAVYTELKAHGRAVGMPTDEDMGNSEVGHNAIGAGRVFDQGASLVENAINSRSLFEGPAWRELIANAIEHQSQLHFIGLLSDGNVHSHIRHLLAMLKEARAAGVLKVRVHILLDGRDVSPQSALVYVDALEAQLKELSTDGADYAIASGGGRQVITMDRYEANWPMVEKGWNIHWRGVGPQFPSARAAIEKYRADNPDVIDQDVPPFVIVRDGKPVGALQTNDSVIMINFRGDRALETCRAFEEENFTKFDRGPKPQVLFAGMMEYDGDTHTPKRYLVSPPAIDRTMGAYLTANGVSILATSETQKYGHVTYFFNGNRSGKFSEALEDYVEVKSDRVPFEERPWMKAAEITDVVLESIGASKHRFIRLNYPNGDMVGHTGVPLAVQIAVEATDLSVGRLMHALRQAGGILVLTADHGNADEMYERNKKGDIVMDERTGRPKAKTSHTLNPVPCFIWDPAGTANVRLSAAAQKGGLGITSLTATCIRLLGFEPPADYDPAIVDVG